MKPEILRAWWFHKQGLDHPSKSSASEVLEETGWARSVGGVNPYLTLFARAGLSKDEIEGAVAKQEIQELPSARGCTYVVPKKHYALALTVGHPQGDPQDMATAKKFLGVTEKEIAKLESKVVDALAKGPKDPKEIKEIVGEAARSLGEEGKKRGVGTTLPLALGRLQSDGRIRRISADGRLDNQRYKYAVWNPSPLKGSKLTRDQAFTELARLYFKWIGPASIANYQWFSGLGVAAAKKAIEPLKLVALEEGSDLLLFPKDLEAFNSFKAPKDERIALTAGIDGIVHLRRDLSAHMDTQHQKTRIQAGNGLQDLDSHGIFDRGQLIGLWEYDPGTEDIAWMTFTRPSAGVKKAVKEMEKYIREQLGDARSFSLDSPASRKPKIEKLRKG